MNQQPSDAEIAQAAEPTPTEPEKTAPSDSPWSDREIANEKEDRFSFQDYADVLAGRAATADTPLTIGIYGRWGSGKSSLMRLIQERLRAERVTTTWLNVWQLSNEDELWNAFLQAIVNKVRSKKTFIWRWPLFNARLLWHRVDWWGLPGQIGFYAWRALLAAAPLVLARLIPADQSAQAAVLAGGGLASLALGLYLVVRPFIEAVRQDVSVDFGSLLKTSPYQERISVLDQFQDHFQAMVKALVGKRGRLVLFIDDLDRCAPDKVAEVLEAIKLFTTTENCVYVLGLDHDIVRQGIQIKYKFDKPTEATEYLEKIVQIPFHLPPLDRGRVETFVREYYPDLHHVCSTAPDVFSTGLEPNPRKVKRASNVYRTLLALEKVRVDAWEMDPVDPELVAKMVVIENRFRRLHQYLIKEPEFLLKLEEKTWQVDGLNAESLRKDEAVGQVLIGKPATGDSEAEPGLIDPAGLAPLNAMLLAGEKSFNDADQREQVSSYIYLSATTEGGAEQIRPSREEGQALLGGDRDRIQARVEDILSRGADEQAQQRITQAYLDRLQGVLADLDRYTDSERVSANLALDLLEGRQEFEPAMLRIPASEFLMGSDPSKDKYAGKYEQPQHRLHLPDYAIAKTPVTNAQYLVFVGATDHSTPYYWEDGKPPKDKEDHPVVHVTWHDAIAYCNWLAEATGKGYRLPSEAEWEKAARGTVGRIWPWGDEPPDENRCNFGENVGDTTPVGRYSPQLHAELAEGGDSPYGCEDMAGNVWEWTLTLWGKDRDKPDFKYPYDPADGREDLKAGDDIRRVMRGGAFFSFEGLVRCADRYGFDPGSWYGSIGFRVCVAAQQE